MDGATKPQNRTGRVKPQHQPKHVAVGIEGQSLDRVAALVDVAKTILASRQVERTIRLVLDKAQELTGAESAGLLQPEQSDGLLHYTHAVGLNAPTLKKRIALPLGHGVAGRAARENSPVWTTDYLADPNTLLDDRTRGFVRQMGLRAALAVPLALPAGLRGALIVHYREAHEFSQEEIDILFGLASLSAIALENANVHEAAHQRSQQLAVLNDLTRRMTIVLNPEQVGNEILAAARTLIPEAVGRFWQRTSDDSFRLAASIGLRHQSGPGVDWIGAGQGLMGVSATSGQPVTCDDVLRNKQFLNKEWAKSEGLMSAVFLPLIYAEYLHGILAIFTRTPHHFAQEEVHLLMSFAAQAAIALQNAQLFGQAARRADQMRRLNELSRIVSESLDIEKIQRFVVSAGAELLGADFARLWLVRENASKALLAAQINPESEPPPGSPRSLSLQNSLIGHVIATAQPRYSPELADDPLQVNKEWVRRVGAHSQLVVPLLVGNRAIGALGVLSRERRQFGQDEIELLQTFAAQAAIAIENARLYGESERRHKRLATLVEVSQRLTRGLDQATLLDSIADAASALFEGEAGFRLLEGECLVRASATPHAKESMLERVPLGVAISGRVAQTGEPLTTSNRGTDERLLPEQRSATLKGRTGSMMCVPVRVESRMLGTLQVFRERGYQFSQDELNVALSLADEAAIAIENARLYAESELRHRRLATLVEISQRLTRGLDLPTVLDSIAGAAATLFEGEAGFRLLEGEYLVRIGATPRARRTMARERIRVGESLSGIVAATGEPIVTSDGVADSRMLPDHRAAMEKNRMSAMMCVPVRVESRTLGTLHIMRERGYQFSQDELSLALSLADQAAIAIENARLHQAALEAAGLEAEARGRLEGISLTARELAHLLNNDLAVPVGLVELLQRQRSDLHGLGDMLDEAARGLEAAVERIRRLQQVVRVETKQTPVGPALDLERSSSPY